MNKEKIRVHIFVSGRVQMVLFRYSTRQKALRFGVNGWVINLNDGRVEMVLEGSKENVRKLIEWAKKGPFLARVNNFDLKYEEYKNEFNSFEVKY
ncbi:MAG: acylphosphatase [Candidatus Nealsonbacteria bacterium]